MRGSAKAAGPGAGEPSSKAKCVKGGEVLGLDVPGLRVQRFREFRVSTKP